MNRSEIWTHIIDSATRAGFLSFHHDGVAVLQFRPDADEKNDHQQIPVGDRLPGGQVRDGQGEIPGLRAQP